MKGARFVFLVFAICFDGRSCKDGRLAGPGLSIGEWLLITYSWSDDESVLCGVRPWYVDFKAEGRCELSKSLPKYQRLRKSTGNILQKTSSSFLRCVNDVLRHWRWSWWTGHHSYKYYCSSFQINNMLKPTLPSRAVSKSVSAIGQKLLITAGWIFPITHSTTVAFHFHRSCLRLFVVSVHRRHH